MGQGEAALDENSGTFDCDRLPASNRSLRKGLALWPMFGFSVAERLQMTS